jgi:hypothetical protein
MRQFEQHLNLDRNVMLAVKYICSSDLRIASMLDLKGYDKQNQYSKDEISDCVSRLILERKLVGSVHRTFSLTDEGRVWLSK